MSYDDVMPSKFAQWLTTQPKGTQTSLMYATRLSWNTLARARGGVKVSAPTAVLIADATNGAVDPYELTNDHEGLRRLLAFRKRRTGTRRAAASRRRSAVRAA